MSQSHTTTAIPSVSNIQYDPDGQRTSFTDGTGTSTWAWDSLHRLVSYTNGNGAQVQWAYNLRNLPSTITYPGGSSVAEGYDNAGRWISAQDWNSNQTTFGYDSNSNLTTETFPSATGVVDTFTFSNADQVIAVSSKRVHRRCSHLPTAVTEQSVELIARPRQAPVLTSIPN